MTESGSSWSNRSPVAEPSPCGSGDCVARSNRLAAGLATIASRVEEGDSAGALGAHVDASVVAAPPPFEPRGLAAACRVAGCEGEPLRVARVATSLLPGLSRLRPLADRLGVEARLQTADSRLDLDLEILSRSARGLSGEGLKQQVHA
jgi:hypothetical protein